MSAPAKTMSKTSSTTKDEPASSKTKRNAETQKWEIAKQELSEVSKEVNAKHIKELVECYDYMMNEPLFQEKVTGMPDKEHARGEHYDEKKMVECAPPRPPLPIIKL